MEVWNSRPTLCELQNHVMTVQWQALGIQLGLNNDRLEEIRREFITIADCRLQMFQLWLSSTREPSRQKLLHALKTNSVAEICMAEQYENYISQTAVEDMSCSQVSSSVTLPQPKLVKETNQLKEIPELARTVVQKLPNHMKSPCCRYVKRNHEIARGSMKTVWKGLDVMTGSDVAWCEILTKNLKDKKTQVENEIDLLKDCKHHPNVLNMLNSFKCAGDYDRSEVIVLITEFMTEGSLNNYIETRTLEPHMIRKFGHQILNGLHFLHSQKPRIVHRNLNCDNIFTDGSIVRIGGLRNATLRDSYLDTEIGTHAFMAPEMFEGRYDRLVDVYAFGMCLLQMCTKELPYAEYKELGTITFNKMCCKALPCSLDKVTDTALKEIIVGCIKYDKNERLTVQQLLDHEFFTEVSE